MRNLHVSIRTELGEESVSILRTWEKLEKKIANFKNHRRFILRCISQKITLPQLETKKQHLNPRGKRILCRAEKQLADEHIRSINNTTMKQIKGQISVTYYKECCEFMEKVREHRQRTTLERHLRKYECLCQQNKGGHSNIGGHSNKQQHHTCMAQNTASALTSDVVSSSPPITLAPIAPAATTTVATMTTVQSKWVKNLSQALLTEAQVSLPAHGPNFTITPRNIHYREYITAVEQACLNLEPHNAEGLRAEIRELWDMHITPGRTLPKKRPRPLLS